MLLTLYFSINLSIFYVCFVLFQSLWDPQTAIDFLDYFLTFAQQCFKNEIIKTLDKNLKNMEPTTIQFDIDADNLIKVTRVNEIILPEWYIQAKREMN